MDSLNNMLRICLVINKDAVDKFPFPRFDHSDTLTGTCFRFSLLHNGKPLKGSGFKKSGHYNYWGYNQWMGDDLVFYSDSVDLKDAYRIPFFIPYYALHQLHRGPNELELKVEQETFFSAHKFEKVLTDSTGKKKTVEARHIVKAPLLSGTFKFTIHMPQIFKTTIYGHGIELRNDSVYSPAGMDNTIWNSSYPDIYWTIDFPDNEFYCSSDYETSTDRYETKDTFFLYHYSPGDSICIGVWDHDNLSRDDYISWQRFSLSQFASNKLMELKFDNVKKMELKAVKEGWINK